MEQSVVNKTEADQVTTIAEADADANPKSKWPYIALLLVVVILVIVLAFIFTKDSKPESQQWSVGYSTGVSLITSYAIDAKVRSRLATTELTMEVANALNCSSVHVVTLQLPFNTRVTSLQTMADDGCTSIGEIQELKEAQETFEEQVAQGLPGAYVEVEDAFTYSLQVSIPPLGVTKVNLVVEQILQQQLGEVLFQIPLIPNEEVDKVVLDLSVQDLNGDPSEFIIELETVEDLLENSSNTTTMDGSKGDVFATEAIHLDIPDARQYNLPRVVRGRYKPGLLPESGLLYADNRCFEHYFVPDSSESMPRNIFFLLDTSRSMNYNDKLIQAKEALVSLIDTMTPQDTFAIQTFGRQGTEDLWGAAPATQGEKEDAKKFLRSFNATSSRTNLNEALLEGLLRAKNKAETSLEEENSDSVTILFLISDGYASAGETSRSKIANHVYELNKEGKVKIFSMGFQNSADMELLDAIAIMNGGVSAPILAGQSIDFTSQIVDFFSSQFGKVLLSDVNVDVNAGNTRVFGETQQTFSLLSSGYEVAVRGLLDVADSQDDNLELRAVTSAATLQGINEWEAFTLVQSPNNNDPSKASLCFQSYAHARVTQLMRLYEASKFIDHHIILELVTLANPEDCDEEKKVDCIKAEALALALEANLVAKGLTAMVTIEHENTCKKTAEITETCLDGTTPGGSRGNLYAPDAYYSAGTRTHAAVSFLLALWAVVTVATTVFCW